MAIDPRRVRGQRAVLFTFLFVVSVVATACSSGSSNSGKSASTTTPSAATSSCTKTHWGTGWAASPTDAAFALDATFGPLPARLEDQTVRNVITPHLGSSGDVRLHLTNRFNTAPVTFQSVTIGVSRPGGGVKDPVVVEFEGNRSATAAPGADLVSDPVAISFKAFEPLAVSLFLPTTAGQLTKHWNSNATTFITTAAAGDQTGATSGAAFTQEVYSWLGLLALDVQVGPGTSAIVTFGDSITDGWVGASATQTVLDVNVADKNVRYPDDLQRRLDRAHLPIAIVNAGVGGNQILSGGAPTGPSGVDRFAADVVDITGVRGVIIFEGINDLGLSQAPASAVIGGLEKLVAQAEAAHLKVWLATITPASDSSVDGVVSAPNSERDRQVVNDWIRSNNEVDGFFDFDAAVRDPANPAVLSTQYGSPDRLHLNPTGYEKLAATVDLKAIAAAQC